jgi:predicted negative regulator of RcsB-dependent stress response
MTMTELFYLLTLVLPLMTVLIVFAMRYYANVQQERARQANDVAYRKLAESASASQSQIATSLAAMEATLSDVRTRVAAVEVMLKAVE